MSFKTLNSPSLLLLVAFVFFINYGFSQSTSVECPDCSKQQIKYDSISTIYTKAKKELKSLDRSSKTEIQLQTIESNHTTIQNAYQKIVGELDACLSADRSGECAECKEGKLVFKDGDPCDDGDPCTKNDRCVNGICIGDPVTSNENPECAGGKK